VSVPYFTGLSLNYIGFLIISSVQLGATVDYAILFAGRYLENRAKLPKKAAVIRTIQDSAGSILTSAGIMTTAGLVLGLISTNSVISQLGILIARGASLSALLVLVLLPALLGAMEPLIKKTSRKLTLFSPSEIVSKEAPV
jgi:predicted RND superfamily exporter protein